MEPPGGLERASDLEVRGAVLRASQPGGRLRGHARALAGGGEAGKLSIHGGTRSPPFWGGSWESERETGHVTQGFCWGVLKEN